MPDALTVQLRFATLPRPLHAIAVHYWFVVLDPEGGRVRWEVWQDPDRAGDSWRHLHRNMQSPDRGVGGGPPGIEREWTGEEARTLAAVLADPLRYPFRDRYRAWPGPNSNTYVSWALREAGLNYDLDPRAIGRDYRACGRGCFQLGSPLLGLKCGRGAIEVQVLGFAFGAGAGALITPFGRLPSNGDRRLLARPEARQATVGIEVRR